MRLAPFTFLLRHFLFVGLAIAAGCVGWLCLYGLLLLMAIVTGSGIGGPLALPAGMLFMVGAGMLLGWGIFAPACAIGLLLTRALRWPRPAAIPLVFLAAGGLLLFWGEIGGIKAFTPPLRALLLLSLPLGAYWWLTEGPSALWEQFHEWASR